MRKTLQTIARRIAAELFNRWRVSVVWEDLTATYWARSEEEAREWLATYPAEARATVEHFPFFCGAAPVLAASRQPVNA